MQSGGAMSNETIRNMKSRGASREQVDFAQRTQYSMDPRDVRLHRAYIEQYNSNDPWRHANNFVMHPLNYRFGQQGPTSQQEIGAMLGQLPGPVYMNGPYHQFHPAIAPHIVWR